MTSRRHGPPPCSTPAAGCRRRHSGALVYSTPRRTRACFMPLMTKFEARSRNFTAIGPHIYRGLPEAGLNGERGRHHGSVAVFAAISEKGDYLDRRHVSTA